MFSSLESVASLPPDIKPRVTDVKSVCSVSSERQCVQTATSLSGVFAQAQGSLNWVLQKECGLYSFLCR